MKKLILTLSISILIMTLAKASEDVIMSASGTYTVCSGNFYDAGGPDGDYINNQNTNLSIYPARSFFYFTGGCCSYLNAWY